MISIDWIKYAPGKIIILDVPPAFGKTLCAAQYAHSDINDTILYDNIMFVSDYHKIAGYKNYLSRFNYLYRLRIDDIHKPKYHGSLCVQNMIVDDIYDSDLIIDIINKYNVQNKIIININRHRFNSGDYGKFITSLKSAFANISHLYMPTNTIKAPDKSGAKD